MNKKMNRNGGLSKNIRRGSMSLEVLATLGITLPIALVGLHMARIAYRALYSIISIWTGSPFF